jgi:DNA mismatch repair protein MutS2
VDDHATLQLDAFSRETLEFPSVVALLARRLSGSLAASLLARLEPGTNLEAIRREHVLVGEAIEFLRAESRPSFAEVGNPRPILERLRVEGQACSVSEILNLLALIRAASEVRATFAKTDLRLLAELASALADFSGIVEALEGKILPDGTLDSSASPELKRLRQAIVATRAEIERALEKLVRRLEAAGALQDAVVTLRNERFVLPVKVEEKRRVEGVVHGASASGATVFVEPLETLPLNNELVELQEREAAEILRILALWSAMFRERWSELVAAVETLSRLDLAFAKAEFARAYDACLPVFESRRAVHLSDARHPLLEAALATKGRHSVPVTFELSEPKTLMIISGPNTGGKTVTLKTVGLAALMAQAGMPVLASEARLPVFGRVLADIGDQQSIEASLSTFSAHVTNIQAMAAAAGPNDLVLLDELGASTDPNEGAALAIAVLEHFRRQGSMSIATTHHSRLKAYAAETTEAENAAMEFDEATLQPTYRLLIGLPGKSSGIEIAERLGLEPSIVREARRLLPPADMEAATLVASLHAQQAELEKQLSELVRSRQALDEERKQLAEIAARERRAKLAELDKRLEETIRRLEKKWELAVGAIHVSPIPAARKKAEKVARQAASLAASARDDWNAEVLEALGKGTASEDATRLGSANASALAAGDKVRVRDLSTPGTVISVSPDEVEVEVGRLRMRVPRTEVRLAARPPFSVVPIKAGTHLASATEERLGASVSRRMPLHEAGRGDPGTDVAAAEINVIGATAEEARERVDKFLDESYLGGRYRLRVVHGHGKGILKKALHEMFSAHPHVEKFYPAPPREGGTGATIVELKA